MRRSAALVAISVALALCPPAPAAAVTVGPPQATPITQRTQTVADADGNLHGFGDTVFDRDAFPLRHVERRGGRWAVTTSPYVGSVYDVAHDRTGTYVLFRQHPDDFETQDFPLMIAKRTSSGVFLPPRRLDTRPINDGSLVVRDGRWWAVWSTRDPASNSGGELRQAGTLGQVGTAPHRISGVPAEDHDASLALWGSGARSRAVLVWSRSASGDARLDDTRPSQLWIATADLSGRWRSRALTAVGTTNTQPAVALSDAVSLAWYRDGAVWTATNRAGDFRSTRLGTMPGDRSGPYTAWSGGHDFVATSVTVFARANGRWTAAPGGGSIMTLAASRGSATVLVAIPSFGTWARSVVP